MVELLRKYGCYRQHDTGPPFRKCIAAVICSVKASCSIRRTWRLVRISVFRLRFLVFGVKFSSATGCKRQDDEYQRSPCLRSGNQCHWLGFQSCLSFVSL